MVSALSVLTPTVSTNQSVYPGSPPIFLGRSLDLLWALWGQLKLWSGLLQLVLASKVHNCLQSQHPQIRGNTYCLFRYSTDAGFTKPIAGFTNPLLLQLHKRIPFLFFGHIAPGAQLWFGPTSSPVSALFLFPAQTRRGESSGWLRLTYSGHGEWRIWQSQLGCIGSACGSRGWQEVATAWIRPCVLLGSWPWITGPLPVPGCTGSQEGVGSNLGLLTVCWLWQQPLHPPLGSEIAAAARTAPGAHKGGVLPFVSDWSQKHLG